MQAVDPLPMQRIALRGVTHTSCNTRKSPCRRLARSLAQCSDQRHGFACATDILAPQNRAWQLKLPRVPEHACGAYTVLLTTGAWLR